MRLFIGSDHGGFELKEFLKKELSGKFKLKDFGCKSSKSCDYPEFAEKVAKAVAADGKATGILCCGTGIGMAMAANKIDGVRAAVAWDDFTARMAKEHNNANVLCLGGRVLGKDEALEVVQTFLKSKFEGSKKAGERHKRRVAAIDEMMGGSFPRPVVGAIILNDKNEVFLMKSPKWDNKYIIPGGHIELGETRIEALRREVKEETGLDVYDEKTFVVMDGIFPKNYGRKRHLIFNDFLLKAKPGKVKLDKKEGTSFVWMTPKLALEELDLEEYTKRALQDWVKIMDLAQVR